MLLVLRFIMFTPILAVLISVVLLETTDCAPIARARQYLPAIPGYVPVYIRAGDTPLEDINPDLAEAFNSYGQKHGRLVFGRSNDISGDKINVVVVKSGTEEEKKESDLATLELDVDDRDDNRVNQDRKPVRLPQHIQIIPRSSIL